MLGGQCLSLPTERPHPLLIREMSLHQGARMLLMLNENSTSHQLELTGRTTDGPCTWLGDSEERRAPTQQMRVGCVDGCTSVSRMYRC